MLSFARNPSELVYRQALLTRVAGAAFALVVLGFLLAMWPSMLDLSPDAPALLALVALWLTMIAGCLWMALSVRSAFIFGTDAVVAREWWGTRSLSYADIAGCTVVLEEHNRARAPAVRGYRLTFQAMRPGIRPLQLFVQDDLPLDPAIVRRLKTVPGLSRRQLKILEMAASGHVHSDRMSHSPERAGEH